jgi:uncharacterized protein YfaS (alpha-2-macroglobulin family)
MKKLILASLFLVALPAAAQERFYLSTERVFAPGEPAEVLLEANGVHALQVRLYRIENPRAWFDAQADLHRPVEESEAPRSASWPLLSRGARTGLNELLQDTRKLFGKEARESLTEALPELHRAASAGGSVVEDEKVLPPLQEHPLLEIWSMPLSETEGWTYDSISIPAYEPGAYLVEATSGSAVASTVVLITDVAIVTKQSSSTLYVWAVDPASGEPRADVKLNVLSRNKELASGTTQKDGTARFDIGLVSSPVIYASLGQSFTLLDPRFFSANLPEPRAYLYTERPVYRPGQEVLIKGFARNVKDETYVLLDSVQKASVTVIDPNGESSSPWEVAVSAHGSFDTAHELPEDPPLGMWQVVAEIAGKRHAGQFKVLSYVKPEVQLSVRLDKKSLRSGETVSGDVVGAYYFGAPYPDAPVKVTVTRTRFYIPWWVDADYSWYYSEAEYQNTKREVITELECVLDKTGECPFSFTAKEDSEDYTYVIEAVSTDPSGKTITGVSEATVTRGAFRLAVEQRALVVEPNEAQKIDLRAEDYSGNPVKTSIEVRVSAKRLAKDGVVETVEVLTKTVQTDQTGKATVELKPERGGYYEVFAKAKDDRGTDIEATTFLFASEGNGDLPFTPGELEIVTDKKSYFSGETALVLILGPVAEGKVWFSVEGGELYRAEVVSMKKHATLVRVEIGDKQTPNFFLGAVAVSGGQVYSKTRSVIVPPREKILSVEVAPNKSDVKPGDEVSFTVIVTDHRGKAVEGAEVALGVVDEAIYAISPEIAVPLESFFYHRKRNDVRTTDSVSFRFFGSSRGLETALNGRAPWSYGSLKPQVDDDRKVFKDTAGFFPSLLTNGEGKANASLVLPDNLTAWRATARVVTHDTRVGMSTAKVRAKKPLVVRVALPSGIVEGDRGKGAVMIQNLTGKDGTFAVSLSTEPNFVGFNKELAIANGATARIPLEYEAKVRGAVKLVARASGNGESDGLESTLAVREWSIARRFAKTGRTTTDAPKVSHTLELPEGTKLDEVKVELELMRSSAGALRAALPYLLEFPYGCTEQTMSRFLPALSAKTVTGPEMKKEAARAVAGGISRLAQLQHEDGGWGWWEQDQSDVWMTAWVMEGLAEAKKLGEELDLSRAQEGANALERMLSESGKQLAPTERAFAVYALARNGKRMPAMLEQLYAELNQLPPAGIAYVALAAKESGSPEIAAKAITELLALAEKDPSLHLAWWPAGQAVTRAELHPLEATSLAVLALYENNGDRAVIEDAIAWIAMQFDGDSFGSTRTSALAVRALARHAKDDSTESATLRLSSGGKVIAERVFGEAERMSGVVRLEPKVALDSANPTFELEQVGPGSFFHAISLSAPIRSRALPASSNGGLSIKRSLHTLSGSAGAYRVGRETNRFAPGDALLVTLEIEASQAIDHLLVEDLRPAGISPVERDAGLQIEGVDLRNQGGRHREHKDDRTAFFLTTVARGKTKLHYLARAGLAGEYRSLPARAEAMYLPATYHAQSSSTFLEIK